MSVSLSEAELKEKAIRYLKSQYGEDTVRMDVRNNGVEDGSGVFHVDCTVSVGGSLSTGRSGSRSGRAKWRACAGRCGRVRPGAPVEAAPDFGGPPCR